MWAPFLLTIKPPKSFLLPLGGALFVKFMCPNRFYIEKIVRKACVPQHLNLSSFPFTHIFLLTGPFATEIFSSPSVTRVVLSVAFLATTSPLPSYRFIDPAHLSLQDFKRSILPIPSFAILRLPLFRNENEGFNTLN